MEIPPLDLDKLEAEAKLIYQTPAEFKRKKIIDILEVNESAWAMRCLALISELREARGASSAKSAAISAYQGIAERLASAEKALNCSRHGMCPAGRAHFAKYGEKE